MLSLSLGTLSGNLEMWHRLRRRHAGRREELLLAVRREHLGKHFTDYQKPANDDLNVARKSAHGHFQLSNRTYLHNLAGKRAAEQQRVEKWPTTFSMVESRKLNFFFIMFFLRHDFSTVFLSLNMLFSCVVV